MQFLSEILGSIGLVGHYIARIFIIVMAVVFFLAAREEHSTFLFVMSFAFLTLALTSGKRR